MEDIKYSDYTLDICDAIKNIRSVEKTDELLIGFYVNPMNKFIRYRKYPYNFPLLPLLVATCGGDKNSAYQLLMRVRVLDYLEDYIYINGYTEDDYDDNLEIYL